MIHVIGDSHAWRGFDDVPEFVIHHLGPRTAYRLVNHTYQIYDILYNLSHDIPIIFVFGEIDCRIHIYRAHKREGISISKSIERVTTTYVDYVVSLRKNNWDIKILSVSPTGTEPNSHNLDFYATREEIRAITEEFNFFTGMYCCRRDVPFLDIYKYLVGVDGWRLDEYIRDSTHLNNNLGQIVYREYFSKK